MPAERGRVRCFADGRRRTSLSDGSAPSPSCATPRSGRSGRRDVWDRRRWSGASRPAPPRSAVWHRAVQACAAWARYMSRLLPRACAGETLLSRPQKVTEASEKRRPPCGSGGTSSKSRSWPWPYCAGTGHVQNQDHGLVAVGPLLAQDCVEALSEVTELAEGASLLASSWPARCLSSLLL